ncbi:MAG: HXXEE domain-containing protein [Acidimicrobiaceae bacterium]|nr:HXXEE domain-containing protein [Acidimicrobiaceae bacterium]
MSTLLDTYRKNWPRVGAVAAMALGGASVLAFTRTKPGNLRALAVMNSMTMSAHQYEEYVDPGYFPGMANRTMFKSDQPRNWPLNAQGLMCANWGFSALYIPPILFPTVRWLTLPPALLGMFQAVAHGVMMPRLAHEKYSPGFITSVLLHVPIGIATIRAIRAQGPITRGDWARSIGVLALFFAAGVIAPNALYANRESPYLISDTQLGRFGTEAPGKEPVETAR